jgi:glyoxylase-like metal-dependent hydrolase (beta-lactamase superfamily II)
MDYRVISIGTLSRHELWPGKNPQAARTPHATTTLIRSGDKVILVDPGLPSQIISARLAERSGLEPGAITDVFLTNFRPAHRWGLEAFPDANWYIHEPEREAVGTMLIEQLRQQDDEEVIKMLEQDIAVLKRCKAAPDSLAEHVDLFPLPGYTPGTSGLLLCFSQYTALVAGDAILTSEHLQAGRISANCFSLDQARESLKEAIEIADVIIPGHDNIALNPMRRPV